PRHRHSTPPLHDALPIYLQLREPELRIHEELDRVVAGLAMDVDGAREVGRAVVVEPVVVGEPPVRPRDGHELARARMVEPGLSLDRKSTRLNSSHVKISY